jgi:dTDP-glucose 4,6-dehydratase
MKYLIIGGAGGFALHTIEKILELKETEMIISTGRNLQRSKAFQLPFNPKHIYKQIHLVFETQKLIELILDFKPNYIINFAALAYATSWDNSYRYYDTNLTALSKICEALYNKTFLKQFLQIGSSEIYGATEKPALEDTCPKPTSPYAISKLAADLHLLSCYKHNNFPVNIIRPSNCYGRYQLMYRIIPKAIYLALIGEKFPLEGGGIAKKSFMHAYDLADAIIKILKSSHLGEIYNAGVDVPVSMKNIIEIICQSMNLDFNNFVKLTPPRKTEDDQYWIDSRKLMKSLNWEPKINLEEGIKDVIKWIVEYREFLKDESFKFELKA